MENKSEMKELFDKIQKVSNEIKNLEKDLQVGKGSYSYKAVSDLQVTLAVKAAETKFKLSSVAMNQELVSSETLKQVDKDGRESAMFIDNIKLTLRIVDLETGCFLDVTSFGKGIDKGDKGFGKASTYARKTALLNAYKIPTGEDPDENKSEEIEVKKTVSEKRLSVTNYLNTNHETLSQTLSHFNVGDVEKLTEENIYILYSTFRKRKLI